MTNFTREDLKENLIKIVNILNEDYQATRITTTQFYEAIRTVNEVLRQLKVANDNKD